MTSWFKQGRRAIFESLAEVCDKIDDNLKAELQDYVKLRKELESLRRRAAEADRLTQENQDLRSRLHQRQSDHGAPETPHNPRGSTATSEVRHIQQKDQLPLTPVSVNQPTTTHVQVATRIADEPEDWKVEAWKNAAKYQRVRDELKKAEGYVKKRTLERDAWQKYAVDLERKLATFEAKFGNNAQEPTAPRPPSRSPQPGSSRPHSPNHSEAEDNNPASEPSINDTPVPSTTMLPMSSPVIRPQSPSPQDRSSNIQKGHLVEKGPAVRGPTDEDDDVPEMPLPELPCDSGAPADPTIKCEPSSDTPVVVLERPVRKRKSDTASLSALQPTARRVKREDPASDPIIAADLCDFSPATSIDLDESTRLDTPRKNPEAEAARLGLSASPSSLGTITPDHERHRVPEAPPNLTPSVARALQPISPNIQQSRPVRPLKKGYARGLASLAEDGASYDLAPSERMPASRNESASRRLSAMLNGPGRNQPESPIIRPIGRSPATPRPTVNSALLQTPQPRELPFGKDTANNKSKQTAPRGGVHGNTPALSTPGTDKPSRAKVSTDPPFRSRPASTLRLDDFKINPNFNKGHDYAYSEVIRNKDERACIPGCVDMSCCGPQFRAMALAERGNGKRTPEELAGDRKLLENYLGDEAYRLFSMTKQERDELWVEAKMRELADRIGKHRHRFSRMKSPPGFWRTDFPDTQEMEQDRADAKKREAEMIQERYREAMRPKGRWLFRDE